MRRRARVSKSEGAERWETWWEYNAERFLRVRTRITEDRVVSGSVDWLLGRRRRSHGAQSERPGRPEIHRVVRPTLREAAGDDAFIVRSSAVIALGKAGDPEDLALLVRCLRDDHQEVSESAALALGILREPAGLAPLVEVLEDTARGRSLVGRPAGVPLRTRVHAAVGLGFLGTADAVAPLLRAVARWEAEPSRDVPIAAILGLGLLGPLAADAVEPLVEVVTAGRADDWIRAQATAALGRIGSRSLVPLLRRFLLREAADVRRSAVLALGLLATEDDEVTLHFLGNEIRKGRDLQSRCWACLALARIGGPVARKTLKNVIANESDSLQAFGALGGAILGRESGDPGTIDAMLREGLDRARSASVRGAFALASGILHDNEADDRLLRILVGERSPSLRGRAALALGMNEAYLHVGRIRRVVEESYRDPELQGDASTALGILGDATVISLLLDVIEDPRSGCHARTAALFALARVGDRSAIETLAGLVRDGRRVPDITRAVATTALGAIVDEGPIPVMRRLSIDANYRALPTTLADLIEIL